MRTRKHPVVVVFALVTGLAACGSNSPSGPPPSPCNPGMVKPVTLHLTVSGFSKCSCFNGTFTLGPIIAVGGTTPALWSTIMPIMGCPGQTTPAYLKFSSDQNNFGIGITDVGSDPGSGNSDFSPVTSGTCSPFHLSGGGSTAGNITSFCTGSAEDVYMSWSITN